MVTERAVIQEATYDHTRGYGRLWHGMLTYSYLLTCTPAAAVDPLACRCHTAAAIDEPMSVSPAADNPLNLHKKRVAGAAYIASAMPHSLCAKGVLLPDLALPSAIECFRVWGTAPHPQQASLVPYGICSQPLALVF